MLESEHFAGATQASLHFIGDQEGAVFPAKLLCAWEEIGVGCLAAFALNCLNRECSHVAPTQLSIQRIEIIEWHARIEAFHQRTKTFGETFAAHQRERADAESVEGARE